MVFIRYILCNTTRILFLISFLKETSKSEYLYKFKEIYDCYKNNSQILDNKFETTFKGVSENLCYEFIENILDIKEEEKNKFLQGFNNLVGDLKICFREEFDRYFKIKIFKEGIEGLIEFEKETDLDTWFSILNVEMNDNFIDDFMYIENVFDVPKCHSKKGQKIKCPIEYLIVITEWLNEEIKKLEEHVFNKEKLYEYSKHFIKLANFYLLRQKKSLLYLFSSTNNMVVIPTCSKIYSDNYNFELLENIASNLTKQYLKLEADFPFNDVKFIIMSNKLDKLKKFANEVYSKKENDCHKSFFEYIEKSMIFMFDTYYIIKKSTSLHDYLVDFEAYNISSLLSIYQSGDLKSVEFLDENRIENIQYFLNNSLNDYGKFFFDIKWWNLSCLEFPYKNSFDLLFYKRTYEIATCLKTSLNFSATEFFMLNSFYLSLINHIFCKLTLKVMLLKFDESDLKGKNEKVCYEIIKNAFKVFFQNDNNVFASFKTYTDDLEWKHETSEIYKILYEEVENCFFEVDFIKSIKEIELEEIEFMLPELIFDALCLTFNQDYTGENICCYYEYQKNLLQNVIKISVRNAYVKLANKLNMIYSEEEENYILNVVLRHFKELNKNEAKEMWISIGILSKEAGYKNISQGLLNLIIYKINIFLPPLIKNCRHINIKKHTLGVLLPKAIFIALNEYYCLDQSIKYWEQSNYDKLICLLLDLFSKSLKNKFNLTKNNMADIFCVTRSIVFGIMNILLDEIKLESFGKYSNAISNLIEKKRKFKLEFTKNEVNNKFVMKLNFLSNLSQIKDDKVCLLNIVKKFFNKLLEDFKNKKDENTCRVIQKILTHFVLKDVQV